jgi:hypothetical protein
MATTTKSTPKPPNAEFVERARTVTDEAVGNARRATAASIDSYEKSVQRVVDLEHKVADVFNVEPIVTATTAYADLTRDIATAQAAAARTLLRV